VKIDLDELERKARAVIDGAETFIENANRHHELELASPPEVIIALIARIRELEAVLPSLAVDLESWVQSESQHGDNASDPSWKLATEARALLEKGAVLS
jgi:hypothetical protein